jgi:hypothetical protein
MLFVHQQSFLYDLIRWPGGQKTIPPLCLSLVKILVQQTNHLIQLNAAVRPGRDNQITARSRHGNPLTAIITHVHLSDSLLETGHQAIELRPRATGHHQGKLFTTKPANGVRRPYYLP